MYGKKNIFESIQELSQDLLKKEKEYKYQPGKNHQTA
jgi:hypothetical protein